MGSGAKLSLQTITMNQKPINVYDRKVTKLARKEMRSQPVRVPDWAHGIKYATNQAFVHKTSVMKNLGLVSESNAIYWITNYNMYSQYNRVYVPTKSLVRDLLNTSMKGLDVPSLKWPLPGFLICLPKGSLIPKDSEVANILISEVDIIKNEDPRFLVNAALLSAEGYSMCHPKTDFSLDKIGEADMIYTEKDLQIADKVTDKEELKIIVDFALKFLAYKNAVPDDVVVGSPSTPPPNTPKAKIKKPLKAHIVGLNRERKQRNNPNLSESSRNTLAIHWRAGHWRRQHYGKENSLVKIIWIEPVMVGKQ